MVNTEKLKSHYIMLWIIVVIVLIPFVIFHIGYGRWECTEYKTYCNRCEVKGSEIIKIEQQELKMEWRTENERKCICTDYETKCTKEVWTHNIKR